MHNGTLLVHCLKYMSNVPFLTQRNAQYGPIGPLMFFFFNVIDQCAMYCQTYVMLTCSDFFLCIQDLDTPYFLSDGSLLFLVLPILQ